jgi:nucleoside-diphosphate-sugar epimerase
MRVFLAGATGAIGRPLLAQLLGAGHAVTATTRSEARAKELTKSGAEGIVLDAFDVDAVKAAVARAKPDVVVHQLTSLPKDVTPSSMKAALDETARLRRETVRTFAEAGRDAGAKRIVVQSIAFVTRPAAEPVDLDEDAPLWLDGPRDARITMESVRDMEAATLGTEGIEGIVLRYGFLYGPGTWYERTGTIGRMITKRLMPIIGSGRGRQSFVHVDDAAEVTVRALERGDPGIYNVTDDAPAEQNEWLPAIATHLQAKAPFRVPGWVARVAGGPLVVHYATALCGARNHRAKKAFGGDTEWTPRHWKDGFREVFGAQP